MYINYDFVRIYCIVVLGNVVIDYYFIINMCVVSFQYKFIGFQGDIVGSFNNYGFDVFDILVFGGGFVFKLVIVRMFCYVGVC